MKQDRALRRRFDDARDIDADRARQAHRGILDAGVDRRDPFLDGGPDLGDDGGEQRILVVEMVVEGALGDARLSGEVPPHWGR